MVVYSSPYSDSFDSISKSKQKIWDPIKVLDIINPDRDCLTCVGYAPSCRRRCRNPINAGNRATAFNHLDQMAYSEPGSPDIRELLHKIAKCALCLRYHQDQVNDVVAQWERKIAAMSQETKVKKEQSDDSLPDTMKRSAKTRPGLNRLEKEQEEAKFDREWRWRARESQEKEHQERERRKEEDEEDKKKKAQRAKEERDRKDRQRREQQEKEERDKRAKEAAERRDRDRKRREEQERQKAQCETKRWHESWNTYILRWDEFKKTKVQKSPETLFELIPWPVKSGKSTDMTDRAVKEFFRRGPPATNSPNDNLKLMNEECRKWHADRIPRLFGTNQLDEKLMKLFNMATMAAIDMRDEFGKRRL